MNDSANPLEYQSEWRAYNRRWLTACISLPAGATLAILLTTYWHHLNAFEFMPICVGPYIFFYLRFVRLPCPRCGNRVTIPDAHRIERADSCGRCGFRRVPGGGRFCLFFSPRQH